MLLNMYKNVGQKSFVLNDESLPFVNPKCFETTSIDLHEQNKFPNIKLKYKKKFESRMMSYLIFSGKGCSEFYFKRICVSVNAISLPEAMP